MTLPGQMTRKEKTVYEKNCKRVGRLMYSMVFFHLKGGMKCKEVRRMFYTIDC